MGGAAVAWPLAARAQQTTKLQTIGFLCQSTPSAESSRAAAFVQQLRKLVPVEAQSWIAELRPDIRDALGNAIAHRRAGSLRDYWQNYKAEIAELDHFFGS
jgi:hypothetical protein